MVFLCNPKQPVAGWCCSTEKIRMDRYWERFKCSNKTKKSSNSSFKTTNAFHFAQDYIFDAFNVYSISDDVTCLLSIMTQQKN